jgi:prepilin-type N-terminal cleavage/methylation domain-containing protein
MKTQRSFSKSGFTLLELMVVIAILGLLFVVYSRFSYQPQEHLMKAERLANKISSVLHDALLQVTIGRMATDSGGHPIAVTGATLTFGTNS